METSIWATCQSVRQSMKHLKAEEAMGLLEWTAPGLPTLLSRKDPRPSSQLCSISSEPHPEYTRGVSSDENKFRIRKTRGSGGKCSPASLGPAQFASTSLPPLRGKVGWRLWSLAPTDGPVCPPHSRCHLCVCWMSLLWTH